MDQSREQRLVEQYGPREAMEYDVVVVGAGPAGLSAAIRLKQLAAEKGQEINVCVLEKGSEVGAHILSGAVMDPRAINELIPDWKEKGAPLNVPVTEDRFLFLSETGATRTPNWMLPGIFQNHGNYVISLANVVRWLGQQAEAARRRDLPRLSGGAGALQREWGTCGRGARRRHRRPGHRQGRRADGRVPARHGAACEVRAVRGRFTRQSRQAADRDGSDLAKDSDPQSYAIGIKELWEIDPAKHQPGLVMHTAGWPLNTKTYGGSFLYHLDNNQVMVGFVVGLAYVNPYLSPFEEFQRYKTHPAIRTFLEGGKRVSYGARAITAGGPVSLPKLVFPGGALIGCDAGFLNAARIKGSHSAIKSGMLAAEAAYNAVTSGRQQDELSAYPSAYKDSWLHEELHKTRNFKQWMSKGLYVGTAMVGFEQKVLGGNVPWTLHHHHADHECLRPASEFTPIVYPKPDGKLTFDRLSSVFISNTNHAENQPAHLTLRDPSVPVNINLAKYAGPESRYCPAAVYEYVPAEGGEGVDGPMRLQINAQNCVHCKTCDIKDPTQNIVWVTPEGGGGPNYPGM